MKYLHAAPPGARRLPARARRRRRAALAGAGARGVRAAPRRLGRPRAVHHHGVRADAGAAAARPGARQAHRARSSPTKRAPSACRPCSARSAIYSSVGQLYEPEDRDELLYYKEAKDGQILEEGITEAGAISSWIAAATSYSAHGVPMLPFYIFYSMFGFQRVGDLIWAAADSRARGFLLGATAGRTTLVGRRPAAPGRLEPPRCLDRSRPACAYDPVLRLRARRDPAGRHAPHARRAGGRVLLRHGDERELRASRRCPPARRKGSVRGMYRLREAAARQGPARAAARLGHDPARGARGRGRARDASMASRPTSGA